MKPPIDHDGIKEIDADFERLQQNEKIMRDGAICMDRYSCTNLRVMWILKQNIDYAFSDYSAELLQNLDKVSSSPTWRRLAHASHGLLSGIRDFAAVKRHERGDCRRIDLPNEHR